MRALLVFILVIFGLAVILIENNDRKDKTVASRLGCILGWVIMGWLALIFW
jgi:hypothetical protein